MGTVPVILRTREALSRPYGFGAFIDRIQSCFREEVEAV